MRRRRLQPGAAAASATRAERPRPELVSSPRTGSALCAFRAVVECSGDGNQHGAATDVRASLLVHEATLLRSGALVQLRFRALPEAHRLAEVLAEHRNAALRHVEATDELVRDEDPAAVTLYEVAARLEVALPRKLGCVHVRRQAGAALGHRHAERIDVEADASGWMIGPD